jgi:hypothetical protein
MINRKLLMKTLDSNTQRKSTLVQLIHQMNFWFLFFFLNLVLFTFSAIQKTNAIGNKSYISAENGKSVFTIAKSGEVVPIYASSKDYPGVLRAAGDLQNDINSVTKTKPALYIDQIPSAKEIIIIGTIQKNPLIDKLIQDKKIDISGIVGHWESSLIQVVKNPMPGIESALVIIGSDKRGTIFGIYDLSEQIGVSPWYWWADVPIPQKQNLFVTTDRHVLGEPSIKYRGIFINDEAPALSGWVTEKFGGFNHKFYIKVFELILRMKGNYLWPAMWGRAFNDDDSLNQRFANEYGIVMGTSHHEPMVRAHDEWRRYGKGLWNYDKNDSVLRQFWKKGIQRMNSYESLVTVGMRGDGDMPMSEESNIALLEKIVKDQRNIIKEVTGKDPSTVPQMWALYKEVQDYYDKGMRVPDDITLLLCDDNWGNIRKLPSLGEKKRAGGYGIYYHYDYVGGPRNYKWLNTNQIERVWEQMHLAYEYNVRQIWIVNVGDIKPMEFPIQFFLDYAWNPDTWTAEKLPEYYRLWASQQFGDKNATEIANILTKSSKYNARRKPELLSPSTYSLVNYLEAETIIADYDKLEKEAMQINNVLPVEYKDAFYQLVLHPIEAIGNLNKLYFITAKNWNYARQGRSITNQLGDSIKLLFTKDAEISDYYNTILAGGKWNHMMDQTHIGYTYWQQPDKNSMPEIKNIIVPAKAEMGVAIEGSEQCWPNDSAVAVLPEFNIFQQQPHFIDLYNRGQNSFDFTIQTDNPCVSIIPQKGKIDKEQRIWISVDWGKAPNETQRIPITIKGANHKEVVVYTVIHNPSQLKSGNISGFIENNGYVSMEAAHFTKEVESSTIHWLRIPDLGRTISGMTPIPVNAKSQPATGNSPHLEYSIFITDTGTAKVYAYFSPTLAFNGNVGLKYGISFDNEPVQVINSNSNLSLQVWEKIVGENINIKLSQHHIETTGSHILKFWMVDPGLVLQKIVIDMGGLKPSYLGPPESYNQPILRSR